MMFVFMKNMPVLVAFSHGIPDFKMEKHLIDRRVEKLETEGVTFHYNTNVGVDMPASNWPKTTTR